MGGLRGEEVGYSLINLRNRGTYKICPTRQKYLGNTMIQTFANKHFHLSLCVWGKEPWNVDRAESTSSVTQADYTEANISADIHLKWRGEEFREIRYMLCQAQFSYLTSGKLLPLAMSQVSLLFFFLKENTIYFLSAPQEYCGDECTAYLKLLANLEKNLRTSKAHTKLEQSLGTGYIGPHNGRFPSHSGRKRYRWVQGSFQEHSSHLNHFQCAWLKPNLTRRKITSCCLNTLEGLWLSSSYSLWEKAR